MVLTKHKLVERLDQEFEDCDFQVFDSPTKGTVAVVHFYKDNLSDEEWNRTLGREQKEVKND